MASFDSNKVTDMAASETIPTNNDQNPNTSVIAKVGEETAVSSDLFAFDPTIYSFCKENSIVNSLKAGESGTIEFQTEISNGVYGITILPERADAEHDRLLDELAAAIPELTLWSNRRPNIGDLVFGQTHEGYWIRGYIISVLPYLKVAMIDEAKVEVVYKLASVKEPLTDICAFSGICQLSDPTHKFMVDDMAQCKVLGRTFNGDPDEFDILIITKDFEMNATVKPWVPLLPQLGAVCTEVLNGSKVCVTAYRNHIYLYVRSLDPIGLARHNFIMEAVAKCAATAPYFANPRVGKTALAQLADDGNYYRVTVFNVEKDRVKVGFHDLGRREYVDRKTLKEYPECLQQVGYCLSKVYLRDVPRNIPPYQPIIDILENLIETQVPLICTFDALPNVDGVYLKHPNGDTVNNMMLKSLEPVIVYPQPKRSDKI